MEVYKEDVSWTAARQWLADAGVIPSHLPSAKVGSKLVDFVNCLQTGVILCDVGNRLSPRCLPAINREPKRQVRRPHHAHCQFQNGTHFPRLCLLCRRARGHVGLGQMDGDDFCISCRLPPLSCSRAPSPLPRSSFAFKTSATSSPFAHRVSVLKNNSCFKPMTCITGASLKMSFSPSPTSPTFDKPRSLDYGKCAPYGPHWVEIATRFPCLNRPTMVLRSFPEVGPKAIGPVDEEGESIYGNLQKALHRVQRTPAVSLAAFVHAVTWDAFVWSATTLSWDFEMGHSPVLSFHVSMSVCPYVSLCVCPMSPCVYVSMSPCVYVCMSPCLPPPSPPPPSLHRPPPTLSPYH